MHGDGAAGYRLGAVAHHNVLDDEFIGRRTIGEFDFRFRRHNGEANGLAGAPSPQRSNRCRRSCAGADCNRGLRPSGVADLDVAVVGGGQTALSRRHIWRARGWWVRLLERQDHTGGAAISAEGFPAWRLGCRGTRIWSACFPAGSSRISVSPSPGAPPVLLVHTGPVDRRADRTADRPAVDLRGHRGRRGRRRFHRVLPAHPPGDRSVVAQPHRAVAHPRAGSRPGARRR